MNISHEKDNYQQNMFVNSINSSMSCVSRHSKKMEKKNMKKTQSTPPLPKTTTQNQPKTKQHHLSRVKMPTDANKQST